MVIWFACWMAVHIPSDYNYCVFATCEGEAFSSAFSLSLNVMLLYTTLPPSYEALNWIFPRRPLLSIVSLDSFLNPMHSDSFLSNQLHVPWVGNRIFGNWHGWTNRCFTNRSASAILLYSGCSNWGRSGNSTKVRAPLFTTQLKSECKVENWQRTVISTKE